MATTKKAIKKVTAKRAKKVVDDGIYWAVLERKFLGSVVIDLFRTRHAAQALADYLDSQSALSFNKYTTQRVVLSND